ncbi:MAG TPA: 2-hydroxyacid dehydrogenase [Planctomycetota bacterium]|jgi:D-lactate dehydrogenase
MRVAVFSTKPYTSQFLSAANKEFGHELAFFEPRLTEQTAALAGEFPVVCPFVHDVLNAAVLRLLQAGGVRLIALRCAGFNHVDLSATHQLGMTVMHVPAYSPYAVAEHTVGLMMALNRKLHRAYNRVRDGNFDLDGLLGFDMHGCTAGIVGTGKIGALVVRILHGFGMKILVHDPNQNPDVVALGAKYVPLSELYAESDVITLHCPLVPGTRHLIDAQALAQMKDGVMLVNTSRGALVDTQAVIDALKSAKLGFMALDVYEEEEGLFFENLSGQVLRDDVFARLLTFPNVIITAHQGFFTRTAMENIARTTLQNIRDFEEGRAITNVITLERVRPVAAAVKAP